MRGTARLTCLQRQRQSIWHGQHVSHLDQIQQEVNDHTHQSNTHNKYTYNERISYIYHINRKYLLKFYQINVTI